MYQSKTETLTKLLNANMSADGFLASIVQENAKLLRDWDELLKVTGHR